MMMTMPPIERVDWIPPSVHEVAVAASCTLPSTFDAGVQMRLREIMITWWCCWMPSLPA